MAKTQTPSTKGAAPRRTRQAAPVAEQAPAVSQSNGTDEASANASDSADSDALAAAKSENAARQAAEQERSTLEERMEKLERESAENRLKYEDSARELAAVRAKLDRPNSDGPPIEMKSQAFDADRSNEQFRAIRPLNDPRRRAIASAPAPKAKTFLVRPVSGFAGDARPAIVSNCADEADAKAEYFRRVGGTPHKAVVKVEPYGETLLEMQQRQEAADKLAAASPDELAQFVEWQRSRVG